MCNSDINIKLGELDVSVNAKISEETLIKEETRFPRKVGDIEINSIKIIHKNDEIDITEIIERLYDINDIEELCLEKLN